MSEISPIASAPGGSASSATVNGAAHREIEFKPRPSEQLNDSVELSERARYLDHLKNLPPVRESVVQQMREAIASGDYSIDDKLSTALDRLIEDLV